MKDVAKNKQFPKKRSLEDCYQNLEQAKVSGNKFQIKIWTDIIKKLESSHDKNKDRK